MNSIHSIRDVNPVCSQSQESDSIRRRLNYRGRVQGVGFRYTVASIARRFPVVGYVKNLRDGSVELDVEGQTRSVEAFLREVSGSLANNIEEVVLEELESGQTCKEFRIRYT